MTQQIAAVNAVGRRLQQSALDCANQLSLNYVGFVEGQPGQIFHHALHVDPDVTELMLIREGRGRFTFDGKHYDVSRGDLLIYNQGIWHEEESDCEVPFRTVYVSLTGVQVVGLPPGYLVDRKSPSVVSLRESFFGIERRFLELHKTLDEPSSEANFIANQLMGVLLAEILVALGSARSSQVGGQRHADALVAVLRSYIHENYSQRLTLADLGAVAFASPFHVCRVFRAHTGYSPIDYLIKYRMDVAKHYLHTTDHKVATIAGLVGYQSETQFQAVFRRIVGIPPGRYRAENPGSLAAFG